MRSTLATILVFILLAGCSLELGTMTTKEARSVRQGMTTQQVIDQYGKPMDINTTRTSGRVREQWVYSTNLDERTYIYFVNGRVDAVQY